MTTLNVRDYGAVGDGRTDDRAAIQQAIDDASDGDTIYIPETDDHYLIGSGGNGGGIFLSNNISDNVTIRGDGPESFLRLANLSSNTSLIEIKVNGGTINGLEISNLRLSGNADANSRTSGAGYPGIHLDAVNGPRTGHSIDIRHVRVEDTPGMGIGWRTGMDTITIEHVTVDNTVNQHGIQIDSAAGNVDEEDIPNRLRSIKVVDAGDSRSQPGNGLNINGSCVIEDLYVENAVQGNKISNGALHAVIRDARFGYHTHNDAFRETVSSGESSWRCTFENVRFENMPRRANRLGGMGRQNTWILRNVEYINVNSDGRHDQALGITENASFDATNVYIGETSANGIHTWSWSGSGQLQSLQHENIGGNAIVDGSGRLQVGSEENGEPLDLDIPTQEEVGAWTEGSSSPPEEDEDDETDDNPSESERQWTPRWESSDDDWEIITGTDFIGGTALKFEHSGTSRTRYGLSYNDVGEPSDVEIVDKFRVPEFTDDEALGFHARVYLRSSGNNGLENGYWIEIENRESAFRLAKYSDGDLITLERFGAPIENTFYYRRFRAEGNQLKAKIWPASETEPSEWDVEVTDNEHSAGWVGLGSFDTGSVHTDIFSVATHGEQAPLVEEGGSLLTLVQPEEGDTLQGTETIAVTVSNSSTVDDVEYRIGSDSWESMTYNEDTDQFEAQLDTMILYNGEYDLQVRITDDSTVVDQSNISLHIDNELIVETGEPELSDDTVTLRGSIFGITEDDAVDGYFQYRASGADSWDTAGEQSITTIGEFMADISEYEFDTEYEFRAVIADTDLTGDIDTFEVSSDDDDQHTGDTLTIDEFQIIDNSDSSWNRYTVDWSVSDESGSLDTVVSKLRKDGNVVAASSTDVSGESASFTHSLRVRGDVDSIRLSVNDSENNVVHETKSL